jgi:hypothetical protein
LFIDYQLGSSSTVFFSGTNESLSVGDMKVAIRTHKKGITSIMTKLPTVGGKRKTVYIHRLVTNAPDGLFVDHISGDVLDNRKENLRFCNNQMNSFNRKSTNATGYKGVYKSKDKKYTKDRYLAYINLNYKRINLGSYDNAEDAARAYNEKAKELFGEFARLNVL